MESVGFKEWAIVCEALGRGAQSIILRKGGIAEGREGFSFRHREFFLFPTWFHEQPGKVRKACPARPPWRERSRRIDLEFPELNADKSAGWTDSSRGEIDIKYFARLESSHVITSWRIAEALEPFHILEPDVVRERFEYDRAPGLHVALVRIFRIQPAWTIANEKKYGGCRSWVKLPEPPAELRCEPVLTEAEHAALSVEFIDLVTRSRGPSPQSSA
jgi:hypothetical protein